ncbi:plasminogen-related [Holotrichia oblita]|uniref:Plasminogen-related n=1 Tax=Holotrichia oblita TaxID=644536 RepID=A0ACB9TQX7_HOLOL|nr:plasminogen-related [Holotrichia oblita]
MGLDYLGTIGKSESGVRCQAWASPKPLHPVDPSYTDETFSDFSKTKAKNYCRNPSKDVTGPWCYTMAPDNIYETCGIPLCIYTECRVSGPGMEYGGSVKRTTTGKNCLKWNKKRPKVRIGDEVISLNQYHNSRFPDESASYARKSCRNPDGDLGGPWCFVETSIKNEVTKQYCDVPFCQSELCTIITRNPEIYSHYTSFSESLTNFTFGVKLWNPDDYLKANARLVLSLFALPLTGKEIHSLGVGLEIYIDNTKSGLTVGNTGKVDYEKSFGNIKSDQFTYFTLTWWHNILTLFKEGRKEPLFMADYKGKGTLMGFQMNKFRYYSARGTDIIWSLPYCDDSDQCDVHTTIGVEFQRYFPLPETSIGYDLNFYLRATHSAYIKLVVSPVIEYPVVKVMIHRSDNYTRIEYQEHERSSTVILQDALSENLLNYWNWQEFTLSVFMGELQLYIRKDSGSYAIVLAQHEDFKKMRWFSPGSDNSIAHWTFSCLPPADFNPPQAYPQNAL